MRRGALYQFSGSVDQDGFVKPFAPAIIDTPTPANRIYHLKPVDPNIRKAKDITNRFPMLSPTKGFNNAVHVNDSPLPKDISPNLPLKLPIDSRNAGSLHTGQQGVRLPSIGLKQSIAEQEEDADESMTLPTGMTQIVLGWKAEQEARERAKQQDQHTSPAKASPHSLRHILAPDTVPAHQQARSQHNFSLISPTTSPGDAPWPSIYGVQQAISRSVDKSTSAVLDTYSALDKIRNNRSENSLSAHSLNVSPAQAGSGMRDTPSGIRRDGRISPDRALSSKTQPQDTRQEEARILPTTQRVTANITQVSTLYTLSADDLDAVINDILEEDGFVPFVRIFHGVAFGDSDVLSIGA